MAATAIKRSKYRGGRCKSCIVVIAATLAGCGGSSSHATTMHTAPATDNAVAKSAACARVNAAQAPIGPDTSALTQNYHDPAAEAKLATDAAQEQGYLSALAPLLSDAGQRATVTQYASVLSQLHDAMQSTSSADAAVATGQLQGIVQQTGLLLPKLVTIC